MAIATSRYQVIWNQLKEKGKVEIAAPTAAHARLRKAVIKRKDTDLKYRFTISEANQRAFLRFYFEPNKVTITLTVVTRSDWI